MAVHPAVESRSSAAVLKRTTVAQHTRLAIGVSSIAGGVVLLGSNVLFLTLARVVTLPWTPLLANVALIGGGIMFLRERQKREQLHRDNARE